MTIDEIVERAEGDFYRDLSLSSFRAIVREACELARKGPHDEPQRVGGGMKTVNIVASEVEQFNERFEGKPLDRSEVREFLKWAVEETCYMAREGYVRVTEPSEPPVEMLSDRMHLSSLDDKLEALTARVEALEKAQNGLATEFMGIRPGVARVGCGYCGANLEHPILHNCQGKP